MFNGIRCEPQEIIHKARHEAGEWSLAQLVEEEMSNEKEIMATKEKRKWEPPKQGWLICNVAFELDKGSKTLGVAWVVRDFRGVVMTHSRRAFSNIGSLEEARYSTLLWVAESMSSLHYSKITFVGDFKEIFLALQKPHRWPALDYHVRELKRILNGVEEYQLRYVSKEENRGAALIAQSMIRQRRLRSYVATGHPSWLFELFVNESRGL